MKYYTYIIQGENHWYYVGSTNDLFRRIQEHQLGKGGYFTHHKFKGKLILRYYEEFNAREEAEAREMQLKGWTRKKKEALMKDNKKQLRYLSKKKTNKRKP